MAVIEKLHVNVTLSMDNNKDKGTKQVLTEHMTKVEEQHSQ